MDIDIETGARAAFEALHAKDNRRRNWDRHPDEDSGAEMGRNTFRHMVAAVLGLGAEPEPAADHTYSAMEPGAGLVPVGVAETETLPPHDQSPGERRAAALIAENEVEAERARATTDSGATKIGGGAVVF